MQTSKKILLANRNRSSESEKDIAFFLGGGLTLMTAGDRYNEVRKFFNPYLTNNENLRRTEGNLVRGAQAYVNYLLEKAKTGEIVDVQESAQIALFDTFTEVCFGSNMHTLQREDKTLYNKWNWIGEAVLGRYMMREFPTWKYFKTAKDRKYDVTTKEFDDMVRQKIAEYRTTPPATAGDILAITMEAINSDRFQMTDEELVRHIVNFLWASHDSTRNILVWAIYSLTTLPHVYAKLKGEIDAALPGGKTVSREDLESLPYLDAVVNETLRLYPSFPVLFHRCTEPIDINGKQMPSEYAIVTSTYSIQRDPAFWPAPEVFDPERWSPEKAKDIVYGSYHPFGNGRRRCIGEKLAILDIKIWMVAIFQKVSFELVPNQSFKQMYSGFAAKMEGSLNVRVKAV